MTVVVVVCMCCVSIVYSRSSGGFSWHSMCFGAVQDISRYVSTVWYGTVWYVMAEGVDTVTVLVVGDEP